MFGWWLVVLAVVLAGCGVLGDSGSLPASCAASRDNDKYCLDQNDSIAGEGPDGAPEELYRVVALRDIVVKFPGRQVVKVAERGDRGGYVAGEWNLSFDGAAWVGDDAKVHGQAKVSENAFVYDKAEVSGTAQIYGNALVFGNARVLDSAKIYDRAEIYGNATAFDLAESVFEPDDPARQFWNNSLTLDFTLALEFSYVVKLLAGEIYEEDPLWNADYDYEYPPDPIRPTRIFGDARLYGRAKVWGGSYLSGDARVGGMSRISGGAELTVIRTCGSLWINAQRRFIRSDCR